MLYAWIIEECTQTSSALEAFINVREAYLSIPAEANRTEKDEWKKVAIEAMRKFACERGTEQQRDERYPEAEAGVTVSDKEPTPMPVPDAGPESEGVVNAREPGVVKVWYLGAKLYGIDRVEIARPVSDTVIDNPGQIGKKIMKLT